MTRRRALLVGMLCAAVAALSACAAQSTSVTGSQVHSSALARDMPIEVFVPDRDTECAKNTVLVVFHGRGGDEHRWMSGSLFSPGIGVDAIAQRLIADRVIKPITIVSASIDDSYGVDSAPATDDYDHGPYRRYIVDDLLPVVVRDYGAGADTHLYLGGVSMGGYVALDVALDNPGRFAGVGALSPAFFVSPPTDRDWMYSADGRPSVLERADAGAADELPLFLGLATSDYQWIKESATHLSDDLVARSAPVEMRTATGGHDVNTWRALAEPMLRMLFGATSADC